MTYKKKLIEVALPLDAINKACKDDKDRKTGHIRNLHKWYAPMPLPAWRAALFSSLIDDPGAGHSEDIAKCKRDDLFRELEKILPLDAAKDPSLFDSVKKLIRSAEIEVPTVIDPFCGGGSTLLEAQRLGFKTIGSDLNPVPLLITTVLTRYPSLFSKVSAVNPASTRQSRLANEIGSGFVEDIKYYANLVGERASLELKQYFPALKFVKDGVAQEASVMSWIWTRTARCPNPACSMITPLASSFELTRSNGGKNEAHWINPKIIDTADGPKVEYGLGTGPNPTRPPKSGRGAKFQCIRCTSVLDDKYIRTIAQSTGLGFDLMACVVKLANGKREYLPATPEVLATISSPKSDWKPDLELSTHPQYMGAPRYGMTNLADLFTPRQTKTLEVFSKQVRNICNEIEADGSAVLGEKAKQYAEAKLAGLADVGDVLSMTDAIVIVILGDDILLADLLGPPAKFCHPILDRADSQTVSFPSLHQSFDVLRLQAGDNHMPKAQFLELVGDLVEHALAVVLCGIAPVAIPITELFQFVVQVPHHFLARFNPFSPFVAPLFLPFALLLVCEACPVSVSVRPERLSVSGVSRDSGHHSRFMPFVLLLATAARGIGVDGASCWKPGHRDEPLTQVSEVRLCGATSD